MGNLANPGEPSVERRSRELLDHRADPSPEDGDGNGKAAPGADSENSRPDDGRPDDSSTSRVATDPDPFFVADGDGGPETAEGREAREPRTTPSGLDPLDERTGGFQVGSLNLLSSSPTAARTAAVVQFLSAGLENGDRVALVSRTRPQRLFRAADRFGLPLEDAWREGRLRLLGFRGEYEVRLRRAGSPDEVYAEMTSLLDPMPARLAFDPGSALWEGRGDGSAATAFLDFLADTPATVLATTTLALDGEMALQTELVAQAAAGIFRLEEEEGGLFRLSILNLDGGRPERPDVTLQLREGEGLTGAEGLPARRWSDRSRAGEHELLHLSLAGALPRELESWMNHSFSVTAVEEPLQLVDRLQSEDPFGLIMLSLDRAHLEDARRACRVSRRLRPELSVVVLSEDELRASDRAELLRAGASECMTGTINVEELASRLELAGSRVPSRLAAPGADEEEEEERPTPERVSGPLDEDAFRAFLRERMDTGPGSVFTVVRLATEGDAAGLAGALSEVVRSEAGDVAGLLGGVPAVFLAATTPDEAEGFLRRVHGKIRGSADGSVDAEILGSVRDAARLRDLAG